ncbi:MAG: transglutaminase domain-containing protein [Armatimonadota bacterium]
MKQAWEDIRQGNAAKTMFEQRRLFVQACGLFIQADAISPLDHDANCIVSRLARQSLWNPDLSLRYARANATRYPESPRAQYELCMALTVAGHAAEARSALQVLSARPDGRKGDVAKEIAYASYDLATKNWDITISFLASEFQRDYAREAYRSKGYYECYCPSDTPYLKVTYTVSGGTCEEVDDGRGTRELHVRPDRENEAVDVKFSFLMQPYCYDLFKIGQGPYVLPENIKPYVGATTLCDPTTDLMQALASQVKGKTRAETIWNAVLWMDAHFHPAVGNEPQQKWFEQYYDSGANEPTCDSLIENGNGHCWEYSRLLPGILRACGIAARGRLCLNLWDDEPALGDWGAGWHIIPEYYETSVGGWVPLEGGRELWPGMVPPRLIPMMGEQPELSNERYGEAWSLTSVEKGWRQMWFGNVNATSADCRRVSHVLTRCSLADPYPWDG